MRRLFTFDDVLIRPRYSTVPSRRFADVSTTIGSLDLPLPIVSSNMATVTGVTMARKISEMGGLALLHRFCSIVDNVRMYEQSVVNNDCRARVGASIGISEECRHRADALIDAGCKIICIDVAHGAQAGTVRQTAWLRKEHPDVTTIVGNFGSGDSLLVFLDKLGIDNIPHAVKVGIGPGAACTTRIKTGVGVPQLSAIMQCVEVCSGYDIAVIADGGCREPQHVCKALAAGAKAVMLGYMLAGSEESPGKVVDGMKTYAGSAAGGFAEGWKTSEGVIMRIPYKGSIVDILNDIEGGIHSSMCYVGAKTLPQYHTNTDFDEVTYATRIENGPVAQ